MLKNNMLIDELYISDKFCDLVTAQSCDCEEILIKSGDSSYLISHRFKDDDGYIEIKRVDNFHSNDFTYMVNFGDEHFRFDKILNLDTGGIDGIRFRSEKIFLFIFALEHNLVLTQTTCDLFDETGTGIPWKNDEPLLQIKKR